MAQVTGEAPRATRRASRYGALLVAAAILATAGLLATPSTAAGSLGPWSGIGPLVDGLPIPPPATVAPPLPAPSAARDAGGGAPAAALRPRPKPGPFAMNLYEKGDFMHQQTTWWCVAASTQTMMNIIDDGRPNRSKRYQRRLHFEGRRLDRSEDAYWRARAGAERWKAGLHGLGLTDWRDLLNTNGYGPYELDRARSLRQAIRKAAKAIRLTGKPVGLVVWRGAHAWVMSGFTATADPAYTDDFRIRKVYIQDPWYPYVSSIWGRSRPPNSAVPVSALGQDFLRYDRPGRRHPKRDGRYMLVLPTPRTDAALG